MSEYTIFSVTLTVLDSVPSFSYLVWNLAAVPLLGVLWLRFRRGPADARRARGRPVQVSGLSGGTSFPGLAMECLSSDRDLW